MINKTQKNLNKFVLMIKNKFVDNSFTWYESTHIIL